MPPETATEATESEALAPLDPEGRRVLFTGARTANTFSTEPVSDETLRELWDLAQWPPTSLNTNPMRIVFVRTAEARQRLVPLMSEGNRPKVEAAPVTAVLAADLEFHEYLPSLAPHKPGAREGFADPARREPAARFNATLQAGYFLLAVRAVGLAAGPMGGFDKDGVDAEFLAGTTWRSILTVNIGHPGESPWFDRLPRHSTEDVVRFV